MVSTYKAMLKGDMLEWSDDVPSLAVAGQSVPVYVTILDESLIRSPQTADGQQMTAALERLAARNALD